MTVLLRFVQSGWPLSLAALVVGVLVLHRTIDESGTVEPRERWHVGGPWISGAWTLTDARGGPHPDPRLRRADEERRAELRRVSESRRETSPARRGDSRETSERESTRTASDDRSRHGAGRDSSRDREREASREGTETARESRESTRPIEYRVKSGDRYWTIAKRLLGKGSRCVEIQALNPDVSEGELREGMTLLLPADAGRKTSRPPQPRPTPNGPTTHLVRKGENLSFIAREYYTDGNWQRIYEANRDRMKSPDDVPAGLRLRIPANPASKPRS